MAAAVKFAIVIPAYRAAKTLPRVLSRIPREFWSGGIAVIVNDASPDATARTAEELKDKYCALRVIHHERNTGYGGALKTGLRLALQEGAVACAIVHADGQYAPEIVMEMIAPIVTGEAQIVQGSRMLGPAPSAMPRSRYVANRTLTFLENLAFGTRLAEFHSGYMVYSRKLLEEAPFQKLQDNFNFDAEMILVAHLLGYPCREIAIQTRYDAESSSLAPIPYGLNVLRMIARHLLGHYRRLLALER